MSYAKRVLELRLVLPPPPPPVANFVPALLEDNWLYVSGHGPIKPDGTKMTGMVGNGLSVEQGCEAARLVGMGVLATVKNTLGSLDRVVRLVKVMGMVYAIPNFKRQPEVINGFSDLMVLVFGEEFGRGARSAVGMGSLPDNIPVEVEAIFKVKDA